jgi:hypothetical protein
VSALESIAPDRGILVLSSVAPGALTRISGIPSWVFSPLVALFGLSKPFPELRERIFLQLGLSSPSIPLSGIFYCCQYFYL